LEKPPPAPVPDSKLEMDFVYGYHNSGFVDSSRNNTFYLKSKEMLYHTAGLVIIYDKESHSQTFFTGHDEEVSAVAVHPNGVLIASGQSGRNPPIYVWDSSERVEGQKPLPEEAHKATLNSHEQRICSLDFSHDGKLLVSVGGDDHHTAIVWDWKMATPLASASGGVQTVFDMRFNPYQAYGIPDHIPLPGQAPTEDDAIYTLTSCGVRHIKFWVFLRTTNDDAETNYEEAKCWYLEGNSVNFATKTNVQDITCFDYIDDSEELTILDPSGDGQTQRVPNSSTRDCSRIVAGTADGDLFVFKQPSIKLRYGNSKREPKPWWLVDEGAKAATEGSTIVMKRLWDSHASIVGIIPHNVKAGNKYNLSRKAREDIDRLSGKLRLQSNNKDLREKVESLFYKGPVGHQGGISCIKFNEQTGIMLTGGRDGIVRLWEPNCGVKLESLKEKSGGLENLPNSNQVDLGEILQHSACARSIHWPKSKSGNANILLGTSTNSIVQLEFDNASSSFGRLKELVSSHFGALSSVAMHPKRNLFVTAGRDRSVNMWHVESQKCVAQARLPSPATSVCIHPSGNAIAIGLTSYEFVVLKVVEGDSFGEFSIKKAFQKSVAPIKVEDSDVAMTDDNIFDNRVGKKGGGRGAGLNKKAKASIDQEADNAHIQRVVPKGRGGSLKDEVMDIKFSADGTHLAIAVRDNCIYIYKVDWDDKSEVDSSNYKLISNMKGHTSTVTNIDWSSCGRFLQSTGSDAELLYWEIVPKDAESTTNFRPQQYAHPFLLRDMEWNTWTCMYGWPVMGIWPNDIAVSDSVKGVMRNNHGDVLLVSDSSARIRMMRWPSLPGDRYREYFGHAFQASDAKFTADDSTVVSIGGPDCTIIQWVHRNAHNGQRIRYDKVTTPRRPTIVRSPKSGKRASVRQRRTLAQITSPTAASESKTNSAEIAEEKKNSQGDRDNQMGKITMNSPKPPAKKKSSLPSFPRKVKALYDFPGEDEGELAFKKNDIIVVNGLDEGWYNGTLDGKKGLLPANYVEG